MDWSQWKSLKFEVRTYFQAPSGRLYCGFPWKSIWQIKEPKNWLSLVSYWHWSRLEQQIIAEIIFFYFILVSCVKSVMRHATVIYCIFILVRNFDDSLFSFSLLFFFCLHVLCIRLLTKIGKRMWKCWLVGESVLVHLGSMLWNAVPLCTMWYIWRERNV